MKFEKNMKVQSYLKNKIVAGATGTIILIDSNRNIVVKVDGEDDHFIYNSKGNSIDMAEFSVKPLTN